MKTNSGVYSRLAIRKTCYQVDKICYRSDQANINDE